MPAITSYPVTGDNAKAFRALNKYGIHLADFAGLTTTSSFDAFGNGGYYQVSNWISDGVFANLAAVQAVYPIVQSGTDYVDWVLLQSAVDFLSYSALGSSNRKNTARRLFIPAGMFICNHPLQLGYATIGTPPGSLNGNGYVSVAIQGEGQQFDPAGNGMNGTTLWFDYTNDVGIAINRNVYAELRGLTVKGSYTYVYANSAFSTNTAQWDIATFKDPALASTNWIGGASVNVGVAVDPYSSVASAAAYPARILPSYFGGGTSTATIGASGGSSDVLLDDVTITNFVVGYGRPHGDSNGEFLRFNRGTISGCAVGIAMGHSQARNIAVRDCNFAYFHTAISNKGGTQNNANLHGSYDNIHAAYGYQLFEHANGDWSGPIKFTNPYVEGVARIGDASTCPLAVDGGFFSFYDQAGYGHSPINHLGGWSVASLKNCQIVTRTGLFLDVISGNPRKVNLDNCHIITRAGMTMNANAADGLRYMNGVLGIAGVQSRSITNVAVSLYGISDTQQHPGGDNSSPIKTHAAQTHVVYATSGTDYWSGYNGDNSLMGGDYRFEVPHLGYRSISIGTCSARSGYSLTFPRLTIGSLKADVGDMFIVDVPNDEALSPTYCVCTSISGSNMILQQLNNYYSSASETDYQTNGKTQIAVSSSYNARYICTRVRRNAGLILGSVSSGSAVISDVKHGLGSGDAVSTTYLTMAAGDYYIHPEIERLNVNGSPSSPLNLVSAVDTTAQTITLTNNFNVTDTCYPVVFYVKVFNA